jgi:uncharacterized protein YndB with AHSA1/START domain
MSGTKQETEVRIERSISAPPERVYRAWLDPELISRWMAPGDLRVSDVQIEERVGGRYRISQADAGGERGGFDCEIAELVPNERIAFRWGSSALRASSNTIRCSRSASEKRPAARRRCRSCMSDSSS